jgi:probable HAF family extracellular repeat protein
MWSLFRRKPRRTKPVRRTPHSARPRLEALEDRCCPSSFSVTPLAAQGGGGGGSGSSSTYSVIDLGTLGGTTSRASGVNNDNQVVGYSYTGATDSSGNPLYHAFLWQNGKMNDLGTLGGPDSWAQAINSSGQVVGTADTGATVQGTYGPVAVYHAFLSQNGVMTDLGSLGGTDADSEATGINKNGWVIGDTGTSSSPPNTSPDAFIGQMVNGTFVMSDLTSLLPAGSGWQSITPSCINDNGYVVGTGQYNGYLEAFMLHVSNPSPGVFQVDSITNLGNLENSSSPSGYTEAVGINNSNQVVGESPDKQTNETPFLWQNGTMTGLASSSTFGSADSINNNAQIVGQFDTKNGAEHAFLWQNGTLSDLNSLIPSNSGWVLEQARGLNDSGDIAGYGTINNQQHAFLALPSTTTAATSTLTTTALAPSATTSSSSPSGTSQATPLTAFSTVASSTPATDSVPANASVVTAPTTALAASSVGTSSSGVGWSALPASVLGTIEQNLSQWQDAMSKELGSLPQTVDQLFAELAADALADEPTLAPLA